MCMRWGTVRRVMWYARDGAHVGMSHTHCIMDLCVHACAFGMRQQKD